MKVDLLNLPISEYPKLVDELGLKKYASDQLLIWVFQKKVRSFDEMTNLSKEAREKLSDKCEISRLKISKVQESTDGTKKYLFELNDGNKIESVMIPSEERTTLCISSQVGCKMGCDFCRTAEMGFVRNLTQAEILGQVFGAQEDNPDIKITNIVFMGMGEPLDNYENVLNAVRVLNDQKCLDFSWRRITISTSGLIPQIEKLSKEDLFIKLAVSLNATTDEQRNKIMPINKKYPFREVIEVCKKFPKKQRIRVTFEYVMIKDLNDSVDDAKRLIKLMDGVPAKINLIPYNSFDESGWQAPDPARVEEFFRYIADRHIQVNIRQSRGQDILAACGQLASTSRLH
ncbi:23S rRNA (adenine(2503)-C(2))-methyltransferase RlmN [bacterium]|nr:23S rRNA (adenine(2503)-C(2))-methyltransferase RlmN [bacterium]